MEPVTEAEVRAALEYLFELDPETMVTYVTSEGLERSRPVGELLSGETIDGLMARWAAADPGEQQEEGRILVAMAEEQGHDRSSGMSAWGWVALGALVVGGTWFAVKLAKNGGG